MTPETGWLSTLGRILLVTGGTLVALGLLLVLVARGFPLGRLPGDLVFRGRGVTVFVPLATSLLLSVLLTLLLNLVLRR